MDEICRKKIAINLLLRYYGKDTLYGYDKIYINCINLIENNDGMHYQFVAYRILIIIMLYRS